MDNKIPYDYFNWGPFLFRSKIPNEIRLEMLERSNRAEKPFNNQLASVINDVRLLADEDQKWIAETLSPWFNAYADAAIYHLGMDQNSFPGFHFKNAWVNYQHPNETNPEHVHSADISFSVYLQIPDALKKEQEAYIGRSAGPGGITFRHGEISHMNRSLHKINPEEGDILIFPSTLAHWVIPFKSDCVRISLAGNLFITGEQ